MDIKGFIYRYYYWLTVTVPLYFRTVYYRLFKSKTFDFQGESYKYFYHWYNTTWKNERAIEIPIVSKLINDYRNNDFLEIGNVLSHYFKLNHVVVDKYEKAKGVINQDVVDFTPSKKYDLIVSISTLEHVGWDEVPKDPEKIIPAVKNLKKCLVKGGKLVVTMPIGENPFLDKLLETGELKFNDKYYLKRLSLENDWIEIGPNFHKAEYNHPFPGANVLFLGIYHKE